ncbi:unnamed protein product [Meloidogyne enterolobii]|uniref:Uncharacterized protein n=1 Tax=Meloidogyne enterolobii TaxID=390850 RepID=A0ACB0YEX6_MELEN
MRESDRRISQGNDGPVSPNWLFIDSFLIIEMTKTLPVLSQLSFEDKVRLYTRNGLATIVFSQLYYILYYYILIRNFFILYSTSI